MKKKYIQPDMIYERQATLCSALANPVRLKILDLIGDKEMTAKELGELLQLPKSNLSQHIGVLKTAGILQTRSEGLYQYLSLSMPEVKQACNMVKKVLVAQLEKDSEFIKNLKHRIS
jgi:ArsR family transcriptional regulator, virulence genes transcriptional regulator